MAKGNITSTKKKSFTRGSDTLFPGKLHSMMEFVEQKGLEYIISWVQNGTAIQIHDPKRLVTDILPFFFGQTRVRSFHRQFYMWRFERLTEGVSKGGFAHPFFLKGQKALCSLMSRHVDPSRQLQQLQEMISTAAAASSSSSSCNNNNMMMVNSVQPSSTQVVSNEPLPTTMNKNLVSSSSTTSLFSLGFGMKLTEEGHKNERCFQSSTGFTSSDLSQDLFELPSSLLSSSAPLQQQQQQVHDKDELTIGTIENFDMFNHDDDFFINDSLLASLITNNGGDHKMVSKLDDASLLIEDPIMMMGLNGVTTLSGGPTTTTVFAV